MGMNFTTHIQDNMYIQLKEDENWKSPVLYIHSDEDEALEFINNWKQEVKELAKNSKLGTPLARLDVNTAFCDLLYKIGQYYLDTTGDTVGDAGFIQSWLRCFNESEIKEKIIIINLKE